MWLEVCVLGMGYVRIMTTYSLRSTMVSAQALEASQMVHDYRNHNHRSQTPKSCSPSWPQVSWSLMLRSRILDHDFEQRFHDTHSRISLHQIGGRGCLRFDHAQSTLQHQEVKFGPPSLIKVLNRSYSSGIPRTNNSNVRKSCHIVSCILRCRLLWYSYPTSERIIHMRLGLDLLSLKQNPCLLVALSYSLRQYSA